MAKIRGIFTEISTPCFVVKGIIIQFFKIVKKLFFQIFKRVDRFAVLYKL